MSRHSHVLVGYDGSKEGERALRWAVTEAKRRRLALTVCHAWHWPYPMGQIDPEWLGIIKRMAEHVLGHGVFLAATMAPTLKVSKRLLPGPAASALLHEAADAELIVVGAQGQAGLPLGSAAVQVAALASCPVIVVRDTGDTDGRIVVGVDGSAGGDAALAFAFEEAALRELQVHAVYGCWEQDAIPDSELSPYADIEGLKRSAGTRLERAVSPWRDKFPQVEAWTHLVLKPPRVALIEAAAGADLLVVGDRGAGGIPPLRLGAVSQAMLHHAPCSVVVVHPWRAPDELGRNLRGDGGIAAERIGSAAGGRG